MNYERSEGISFCGRTVLITGSSGLIGSRFTNRMIELGATMICVDNREPSDALPENSRFNFFKADITKESSWQSLNDELKSRNLAPSILVNNAARNPKVDKTGLNEANRLTDFSLEDWRRDLDVSLTGAFLATKYFGDILSRQTDPVILNMASDLAVIAPDQRLYKVEADFDTQHPVKPITYSVTKAGILGLSRYLATYWSESSNLRSNALCPGGVLADQPSEFVAMISNKIPLRRMARLDEVVDAMIWMVSDKTTYMNGAVIMLDGGRSAW